VANLPERLVIYRETSTGMSRRPAPAFLDRILLIGAENLAHWAGLPEPDAACRDGVALLNGGVEQLSERADLGAIRARFEAAGAAIAARSPSPALAARRAEIDAMLRHRYRLARGMPGWAVPLLHLWRALPLPDALRRGARHLLSR
jgi:hypothetical protein